MIYLSEFSKRNEVKIMKYDEAYATGMYQYNGNFTMVNDCDDFSETNAWSVFPGQIDLGGRMTENHIKKERVQYLYV